MAKKRILIAGATGYLGRHVVKALKQRGYWIRVLARRETNLNEAGKNNSPPIRPYVDEVFEGQITQPETINNICDGIDYVFSSIGITRQNDRVTYKDVDFQGNVNLLLEAEKSQVTGFMYIGVLNGREMGGMLNESKELFIERLKDSPLSWLIVRPTGYFSDMESFLQMALRGRVFLIGSGKRQINPIHGADLAEYCAGNIDKRKVELPVGGPRVLSHSEIAKLAFQAIGRSTDISYFPPWVFRSASYPVKVIAPSIFGALEFQYKALMRDMVAPAFGQRDLFTYFKKVAENR